MDNSLLSSKQNSQSVSEQESGWTLYIEDFIATQKKSQAVNFTTTDSCNSDRIFSHAGIGSSSMLSDAASCAEWNANNPSKKFKKLNFMRNRRLLNDDDSLEDTASSPVNSPKVGDVNHLDRNLKNDRQETRQINQKDDGLAEYGDSRSHENAELMSLGDQKNYDYTELRKKGLCLVPISVLIDYLK